MIGIGEAKLQVEKYVRGMPIAALFDSVAGLSFHKCMLRGPRHANLQHEAGVCLVYASAADLAAVARGVAARG